MMLPIVSSYFTFVFFSLAIGLLDITDEGKKHLIYILFGIMIVINLGVFFLDWDLYSSSSHNLLNFINKQIRTSFSLRFIL